MRKLVALVSIVLLSLLGTAKAADFSPSVIIDKVKDSLVRIETKRTNPLIPVAFTGQGGSGFIVSADDKETIVATAKHVVEDSQASYFTVIFEDVGYNTKDVHKVIGTDAAYLIVRPGIKGAKAFNFNLSFSDGTIDAMCCGFAQSIHLRDESPKPTFTVGKLSRKVSQKVAYGGDGDTAIGLVYGTPTLLFGYSGGPCLDLDYQIVGINVAISRQMTIFVDGRVLWNNIPELNKKKFANVPFDPCFHVSNELGESRIALDKDAKIVLKEGEFALEEYIAKLLSEVKTPDGVESDLADLMGMATILPDKVRSWINPQTYFKMNGKQYVIYYTALMVKGYQGCRNRMAFREDEKHYIYLCNDGWQLSITLDEVDNTVIDGIKAFWAKEKAGK